jgi:hypothetical protein
MKDVCKWRVGYIKWSEWLQIGNGIGLRNNKFHAIASFNIPCGGASGDRHSLNISCDNIICTTDDHHSLNTSSGSINLCYFNCSSLTCFNWSRPAIHHLFYHNFKHLPLTQCSITDHNCIIELPKCTWSWCCQSIVWNSCILAMHMMKPEITATEHQYIYYRNLHKVAWGFTSTSYQPKYSQQSEWLWDWLPTRAPTFSSLSLCPEVILRLANLLSNG